MSYPASPFASPGGLIGSPHEQANRLREMQQSWQAAAQFFHAQQQALCDPLAYYSVPSPSLRSATPSAPLPGIPALPLSSLVLGLPPMPDECGSPVTRAMVLEASPYSPGELLSQTAGYSFGGSDCSTTDTEDRRGCVPKTPAASPSSAKLPPFPTTPMHVPLADVSSFEEDREASALRSSSPDSELPSLGSAAHRDGDCKPCAFLHKKGCENGRMCKFCHLCEPGEKKRRAKVVKTGLRRLEELVGDHRGALAS